MARPSKVRIGVQTFDIVFRTRDKDGMLSDSVMGYTLDQQSLIVIDSTLAEGKQKSTLFHELMHATRMVFGSNVVPRRKDDADVWEHYFIAVWENSLLLVLRDNKDVSDWLLS
jgi:Zn-dependent peptidase ImmA (M78 family)